MTRIFVLLFLIASSSSLAQKKNPYKDYWAQQEKIEQAQQLAKEAHKKFQNKDLQEALNMYKKANNLDPDNQTYVAKIRDLNLLIEKQKHFKSDINIEYNINDSVVNESESIENKIDTINKESTKPKLQSVGEDTLSRPEENIKTVESIDTLNQVSKVSVPIKPINKKSPEHKANSSNSKPYKNSDNYKKYIGTIYPSGWTKEESKEGTKELTKLIWVQNNIGTEYLKVKHNYGAVFYFRNGESISYSTWVAETKTAPKD